jgi:hypothetical protein
VTVWVIFQIGKVKQGEAVDFMGFPGPGGG